MTLLISTTDDLTSFCEKLSQCDFITVDTEFLRERTYFPKLCLIQMAGGGDAYKDLAAAIDPLAHGIDLTPLFNLMRNADIIKVFHAARQDIEIFHQLMDGDIPTPIFDTQIAAMVCGLGEQIGYESIVGQLIGHRINKAQQLTDWSLRPLSDAQLDYAIADVTHLRDVYLALVNDKIPAERLPWIDDELQFLNDPSIYTIDPETADKRMKKRTHKPAYLMRLKLLCKWREHLAMKQNKPRGWILHDDAIQEIALTNPTSIEQLKRVRAIGKHRGGLKLDDLLGLVHQANGVPDADKPTMQKAIRFPAELEVARDFLKLLLKHQCTSHTIAPKMLANADDLSAFLTGDESVSFLKGWRYEIFGKHAEAALQGNAKLSLDPKHHFLACDITPNT